MAKIAIVQTICVQPLFQSPNWTQKIIQIKSYKGLKRKRLWCLANSNVKCKCFSVYDTSH